MDLASSAYFSVFAGMFPFLFFFLWIMFRMSKQQRQRALHPMDASPTGSSRKIFLLLAGGVLIGIYLLVFVPADSELLPDSGKLEQAQPPVIVPEKATQSESDNSG